ncbi:hypothetical protein TVAG_173350 [Trichomonas vaginalis G3]|uniref:Uncharacterized protein n=1 Tax=Trichomonas vaginalis (strain ATCC PRA-98 / G3) TaxID=412133 RepID=A2G3G8_TRIV3|nr:hypothetical protein TVAGG3_0735450 [Trichomonas vaginalis G3]EAX88296.1 hypothetical protein TVAG_173350 [Trichomonas vaginalis G3]KAI5511549.1 hypothetical protein TVAGG3_0735450 [Trichomonas vaginalis G3]|eukprot:XP_001301226.1 hypothetical protein [Trichomonas vaginalis G3]
MNQLRDLSDSDANKLLSDLISQNGDLQPDHLILALSRRFFRIAAQILLKGVRSNQIDQCISVLLHAPIEFDESFNTFLAALALENIYLPEVISSIPSVSEKNKQMLLPILAYHLISFEDKPNVEYSENWFVNENILLNAYQNRDTSCLAYQLIEYILSSNLDKLRPKLRLFNANVESINIPIIPRRITELTKAVSSYTKKLTNKCFLESSASFNYTYLGKLFLLQTIYRLQLLLCVYLTI